MPTAGEATMAPPSTEESTVSSLKEKIVYAMMIIFSVVMIISTMAYFIGKEEEVEDKNICDHNDLSNEPHIIPLAGRVPFQ